MSRSRTAQLRDKDRQVTVSDHDTDSPLLPIGQLEKLKEIAPDKVAWVFDETSKEGDFRRNETRRVNTFVFAERLLGMAAGLAIGCTALWASYVLAMNGHDVVAGIIGGTTVVGLVSAFLYGVKQRADQAPNQ